MQTAVPTLHTQHTTANAIQDILVQVEPPFVPFVVTAAYCKLRLNHALPTLQELILMVWDSCR